MSGRPLEFAALDDECAGCAERDRTIASLREELADSQNGRDCLRFELDCLEAKRVRDNGYLIERAEVAERQLAALRKAVRKWDTTLSFYCDGPERDAVRAALAGSAADATEQAE